VLLTDVPDAVVGTVFDYLQTGTDVRALRTACRHLVLAFDAAICNESPTMNGISSQDAVGASWRWCPLFRIPRGKHRAREAYMVKELVDVPASHTLSCDTVSVLAINFEWEARLRHFRGIREVEVRGKICCVSIDEPACNASIHTVLPLAPQHALILHGGKNVEASRRPPSIRHLRSLKSFIAHPRTQRLCDGVSSIRLWLLNGEISERADVLNFLPTVDLSRLANLDVDTRTPDAEALVSRLVSAAPNLETILVRGHGDSSTDGIVYAVAAHCPCLRRVDVSLSKSVQRALNALTSSCPEVEHVVVNGGTGVLDNCHTFIRWRRLRYLELANVKMTNRALVEIGKSCPHLKHLCIYAVRTDASEVGNVGVAALAQGCPKLLHLRLSWRSIGDGGVVAVAEHCRSLTHLDLSDSTVADVGILAVARHCSQLVFLNITGTSVTNVAVSAIATSLPLLRTLYLAKTGVTDVCLGLGKGCPDLRFFSASVTNATALERVLPYWPRLYSLELRSMVPTASLFAAIGCHNHHLFWVHLKPVDSPAFTAPLSERWRLVKTGVGDCNARSVT
jgi:hypothetical protein